MKRCVRCFGEWPSRYFTILLMGGFLLLTVFVLSATADTADVGEFTTIFVDNGQAFEQEPGPAAADRVRAVVRQPVFIDSGQALGHDAYNAAALGDLDGDGDLDAVLQGQLFLNNGRGSFTAKEQAAGFDHFKFEVALGDVDGDEDLDLISATPGPNQVWLNDGDANFSSKQMLGDTETWALALGDVDDDDDIDIIFANSNTAHQLYLNNGSGKFTASGQELGRGGYRANALEDVDGDGDLDAFFADCSLYSNNGSGKFSFKAGSGCNAADPVTLVMGDIDGDGDSDAIIGSATRNANLVMKNDGSGKFSSAQSLGEASTEQTALADIDLDGDLDLFSGNTAELDGDPADRFWLNDGAGKFSEYGRTLGDTNSYGAVFGDVDKDGDPDLLVGTGAGPNKLYFNGAHTVYLPVVRAKSIGAVIPETTKVLDDETNDHLDSVSADGSVFVFSESSPALEALEPGEIMAGDVSDAAPQGFLRKVSKTTAANGKIVVETESATLRDAVSHGEIKFQRTLRPADIEESVYAPGVSLNRSASAVDSTLFDYAINSIIYDHDGNSSTTHDQVRANGRVALNTDIDFDYDLGWPWEDSELEFKQSTSELAQLQITYASGFALKKEIEIASHRLSTFTIWAGPLPVTITPQLTVYIGVDGSVTTSVSTRVDQSASLTYGFKYDGDWQPIGSYTNDFYFEPPQLDASLNVKGYAGTSLTLLLYGVVGPQADLRPALFLQADLNAVPWWKLYAGLEVGVGVRIDILGLHTSNYRVTIYDLWWLLDQADAPPPTCYQLNLYHTGMGSDPVAAPQNSSGCSPGRYLSGETILLSGAVPDSGWHIAGWTNSNNDGSTSSSNALTMPSADISTGVNYSQGCYALNISHSGMGTDPIASPAHSSGCAAGKYVAGERIELSGAVADDGWEIASWTGTGNDSSTASTNSLTMPESAVTVLVNYGQSCYALGLSHTGSGSDPVASPSHSSGCAAGKYAAGEQIQLSGAVPDAGWKIKSWSGSDNDSSSASTNALTMPGWSKNVMVNYTQECHKLTVTHSGRGSDPTASPSSSDGCSWHRYVEGESIQLSGAVPDAGWEISGWTGTNNNGSTASSNSVTMPGSDKTARVNYSEKTATDPVTMDRAYTTDCSGHGKSSFRRGESICLSLTATNHTSQIVKVYFYWDTWDPAGDYVDYLSYYGFMVDLEPGEAGYLLERVIESDAAYGTYEYTATVEYPSGSDERSTTFNIQN